MLSWSNPLLTLGVTLCPSSLFGQLLNPFCRCGYDPLIRDLCAAWGCFWVFPPSDGTPPEEVRSSARTQPSQPADLTVSSEGLFLDEFPLILSTKLPLALPLWVTSFLVTAPHQDLYCFLQHPLPRSFKIIPSLSLWPPCPPGCSEPPDHHTWKWGPTFPVTPLLYEQALGTGVVVSVCLA